MPIRVCMFDVRLPIHATSTCLAPFKYHWFSLRIYITVMSHPPRLPMSAKQCFQYLSTAYRVDDRNDPRHLYLLQ